MFWRRATGRSEIVAVNGIVASSQPLATQAGLEILTNGGNAVDAAIATAAVLDIVEPFSTGCGGDAFVLIHLPGKKKPLSVNGSGRAGTMATLDDLLQKDWKHMPVRGGPPVTVPGAMHLWGYLVEKYGALELGDVLSPAIRYAREGFPVSPIISEVWSLVVQVLGNEAARKTFSIGVSIGLVPLTEDTDSASDVMKQADLACYTAKYLGRNRDYVY